MATLIDSYSESNRNTDNYMGAGGGLNSIAGSQSFTNTNSITLNSVKLYLAKFGSPTGSMYVKIYAHTGTYGTSSVPTGSALATSDALDVSTLSTSTQSLITFTFSGAEKITLNASTYYCLVFYFNGGDTTNHILQGVDGSSPTASGNFADAPDGSTYSALNTYDACFYIYGDDVANKGNMFAIF